MLQNPEELSAWALLHSYGRARAFKMITQDPLIAKNLADQGFDLAVIEEILEVIPKSIGSKKS